MEKKFPIFKTLTLLVMFVLGMGTAFASNFWADHTSQPGTETIDDKPFYSITTAEELAWFALQTEPKKVTSDINISLNAILKNDIDLAGKIWTPICPGAGNVYFNGVFDGGGHSIKNVTIDSDSIYSRYFGLYGYDGNNIEDSKKNYGKRYAQNAALIGTLGSGTVKNLALENISFYVTNSSNDDRQISVGAVVGWKSAKGGTIDFCSASGTIITSGVKQGVGGLVGNAHSSAIKNSISYVNILASGNNAYVGGIVGLTKNNEVKIESCVYAGETLVSTGSGSTVGAVVGNVVSGSVKPTNTYYDNGDTDIPAVGNKTVTGATDSDNLNSEGVVCVLNGGTWKNNTCTEPEGGMSNYWSEGLSGLSLNGSDGYKITFDANGGNFDSGAKTSKILADGETITADEIAIPNKTGKEFAGWATTVDATEPSSDLGIADAQKKIYAVWYDFYTVTFKDTPENANAFGNVQVAKNGMVTVDGFTVPSTKSVGNATYYFTGWAFEPKMFDDENYELKTNDTLHLADLKITQDIVLYAVWTKAKTFSVTFNATLHGKTEVTFVRILTEGEIVSEPGPNDVVTEPGYKIIGWYTDANCTASNKYGFDAPLGGNLTLYAKWEVVEYHINYVLNEGTNDKDNPSTYTINSDDIVLANPTNAGASFDGWFYDAQFNNRATQISKGSSGDKTLYAKWTPYTYVIHYLSGSTVAGTIPSDVKEYGKSIQLKGAVDKFAHETCVQDGWSTEDLGDKVYDLGATYDGNEDLMLYPHWTCNSYEITYEMFGVEGAVNYSTNPEFYVGPATLTLKNANDSHNPKRFFMDDWYKESTFENKIRDLKVDDVKAPITVYAKWYNKIIYKPGKYVKGAKDSTYKKSLDSTYTFTSNAKFTRANYTLDGWSLTDGGEKVYDLGEQYATNENLTLYPHWIEGNVQIAHYGAVTVYTYENGRKEAVVNGEYTGSDAIDIPTPIEVDNIVINRTFTQNTPATIVLPFTLPSGTNLNGAKFYYLKNVVQHPDKYAWKATMTWIGADALPAANTPYTVICTKENCSSLEFGLNGEKATFKTNELGMVQAKKTDKWYFVGTYVYKTWESEAEQTELADGLVYGIAGQNDDGVPKGTFAKATSSANVVHPMRAYMRKRDTSVKLERVTQPQTVRARGASYGLNNIGSEIIEVEFVDDEKTTAIGRMNTVTGEIKIDRWFDLKGRHVKNVNRAAKGAYYGKKVFHE